jgi:hypothetical protein
MSSPTYWHLAKSLHTPRPFLPALDTSSYPPLINVECQCGVWMVDRRHDSEVA